MLWADARECPHCGGAINREDSPTIRTEDRIETWLYCDFCGIGWEIEQYPDGYVLAVDYHVRTEPINFERFMGRLIEARTA